MPASPLNDFRISTGRVCTLYFRLPPNRHTILPITLHTLLRNSSAPLRRASPEATRFALHWGTAIRCRHFCRHRLYSHLTTPHRRTPVSSRVSRPDFVPVSFSSFPFLCEDITLQRSRQDGVAGTVTLHRAATAVLVVVLESERIVDCWFFLHLWLRFF